jgi:hypothetical protein
MKGVSIHTGGYRGTSESHDEYRTIDVGTFIFTTERLIFVGAGRTSSVDLEKLIAIEAFSDGIEVHREGKERAQVFVFSERVRMSCEYGEQTQFVPLHGAVVRAAIQQALEYRRHPQAIGKTIEELQAAEAVTATKAADGTITLKFDKITPKQKDAFDQAVEWINDLTSEKGFKRISTDISDRGCTVQLRRDQDAPVWARMSIRVEFLVDIDVYDKRTLSEHSNIAVDCLIRHPINERHNSALTEEWPLTVSGLNKARERLIAALTKLEDWTTEQVPEQSAPSAPGSPPETGAQRATGAR